MNNQVTVEKSFYVPGLGSVRHYEKSKNSAIHGITKTPNGVHKMTTPINSEDEAGFMAFFAEYQQACCAKNAKFIKELLPAETPEVGCLGYVVLMSQAAVQGLNELGVVPRFEQIGNQINAIYDGDFDDEEFAGVTNVTIDFHKHDGTWLKYNPEDEAGFMAFFACQQACCAGNEESIKELLLAETICPATLKYNPEA